MLGLAPGDIWPALVALTVLTVMPGADTLIVIRNTSRGGFADGFITSLGICSGLFLHALVSAAGISVILLSSPLAFNLLKLAGSAYLIWLGWKSLEHIRHGQVLVTGTAHPDTQPNSFKLIQSAREGFLSNILNPKTVVFYMAFLPQFINPEHSALMQSIALAALHFCIAMLWSTAIALMINKARNWLARPLVNKVFHGVTGMLLVVLSIGLMFSGLVFQG